MSNLSEMLSKPITDLEDPIIPAGTYLALIKGGKVGEPKVSERSGNEYQRASVALKIVEPGHDVTDTDALAGKFNGETVFFESYIMSDRDAKGLLRTLKSIGVEIKLDGVTAIEAVETAIKDAKGIQVYVEVENEMFNNKTQSRAKKMYSSAA